MDKYDSTKIYDNDNEGLRQIYSGAPDLEPYFKQLKIRSVYASHADIKKYIQKKYGLKKDIFKNYCISYTGRACIYNFGDGTSINFTEEEEKKLRKEHTDENTYCLPYKSFSVDTYSFALDDLFEDYFTVIDDALINKAINLIGNQYSTDLLAQDTAQHENMTDNVIESLMDYEGSMDGKLLVGLIIGQYIAKRMNVIAVAEYD